jgi:hypothetical protein
MLTFTTFDAVGKSMRLVLGTFFTYRALPFLKNDRILSGGKQLPTADFAA